MEEGEDLPEDCRLETVIPYCIFLILLSASGKLISRKGNSLKLDVPMGLRLLVVLFWCLEG